jgi:hypothetical protein
LNVFVECHRRVLLLNDFSRTTRYLAAGERASKISDLPPANIFSEARDIEKWGAVTLLGVRTEGLLAAFVGIKRRLNFRVRFLLACLAGLELRIAAFADSEGRKRWFYDPEFAALHWIKSVRRAGRA